MIRDNPSCVCICLYTTFKLLHLTVRLCLVLPSSRVGLLAYKENQLSEFDAVAELCRTSTISCDDDSVNRMERDARIQLLQLAQPPTTPYRRTATWTCWLRPVSCVSTRVAWRRGCEFSRITTNSSSRSSNVCVSCCTTPNRHGNRMSFYRQLLSPIPRRSPVGHAGI